MTYPNLRLASSRPTVMPTAADLQHANREDALDLVNSTEAGAIAKWPWLEASALIGDFVPGRLVVLGARPGNGKTTLLLNVLSALRDAHVPTLYLGTEMAPRELLLKWALMRLNMNEAPLADANWRGLTDAERDALAMEVVDLTVSDVYLPPTPRLDLEHIREWVAWGFDDEFLEGRPPARVVILDHLHRVRPRDGQDPWAAVGEAITDLKDMALTRELSMLVAAQLRRGESPSVLDLYTPVTLGSFKGSSAIEENADVCLGAYRPLRPGLKAKEIQALARGDVQVSEFAVPNTMRIPVLKNRHRGSAAGRHFDLVLTDGKLRPSAPLWRTVPEAAAPAVVPPIGAGDAWEPA